MNTGCIVFAVSNINGRHVRFTTAIDHHRRQARRKKGLNLRHCDAKTASAGSHGQ
jgi:hypothetical protein